MEKKVNVIDLFAGPGGLGEGFFSYTDNKGSFPFEGLISVEKDPHAHSTLTLRAFYRLLTKSNTPLPSEYFEYAMGKAESPSSDQTLELWEQAKSETLLLELGKDPKFDKKLFQQVKKSLASQKSIPTILIGGPPCQAYSLVGRARNKGNKNYIPEKDHRQYLYKEYLSTLQLFSPDIFVMENVKGLLSSQINGGPVFQQIIRDLENCSQGYTLYSLKTGKKFVNGSSNPKDFILYSEEYGVPQNRHRVIIFGIKKNRNNPEEIPHLKKSHPISIERAIKDLPQLRSTLSSRGKLFNKDSIDFWIENLQSGVRKLIKSTDLDKKLLLKLKENLSQIAPMSSTLDSSYKYKHDRSKSEFSKFVKDSSNKKITLHNPRPHMDMDLLRYFFCSTFREVYKRNARASDFPEFLAPDHKSWNSGKFVDRFKVQSYRSQSSTITSHISKDGHYFIHGDPLQCRSLTVREAARIQSFPDSYHFMGYRTNQFHQVGNAVPPLLARQIASIVNQLLFTSS